MSPDADTDLELGIGAAIAAAKAARARAENNTQRTRRSEGGNTGGTFAPSDDGFTAFMNRGILGGLTALPEMVDRAVNQPLDRLFLSDDAPEELTQGPRGLLTDLFSRAGGAVADQDADPREAGLGAEVGAFLGDTLGLAPYAGAAIGAVPMRAASSPTATQGARRIAQEAANTMQRGLVQSPRLAATAEVGAGVGGGLGGAFARENYGDDAEAIGQIAGALGLPLAPAALTTAARGAASSLPFTAGAMDRLGAMASGEGYARIRARETLRDRASDPDKALQNLYRGYDGAADPGHTLDLSPALRTEDPGLIRLQERVAANSEPMRADLLARERDNMAQAQDLLSTNMDGQRGNVDFARQSSQDAVADRLRMIDERVNAAMDDATAAIAAAGPRTTDSRSEASRIVVEGLEAAQTATRQEVNAAWSQVPQNDTVRLNSLSRTYENVVSDAGQAKAGSIPATARQLLDPNSGSYYGEAQDGGELFGFYSEMRRAARAASAAGDTEQARYANQLADAALKDISAHQPTSEAYKNARAASVAFHDRFTRGPIGKILAPSKDGGQQVSEYAALDRILGSSGGQERANIESLQRALGTHNPEPYRAAEDYVRRSFVDTIAPTAATSHSPIAASRYLQRHSEMFDKFPHMRGLFEDTIDRVARAQAAQADGISDARNVRDRSAEGRFSNSEVDKEFASILKSPNPQQEVRQLREVLDAQDPTGQATEGLRQSAREYMVRRMMAQDTTLGPVLRGTKADEILTEHSRVFSELMGPEEMTKINQVAQELRLLDQTRGYSAAPGAIVQPSMLGGIVARFVGLRAIGGQIQSQGIGSFQQNAIISSVSRKIADKLSSAGAERLIMEAMQPGNEQLLRDLLTRPQNVEQANRVARSVEAWVSTLPVSILGGEAEDAPGDDIDAIFEGLGVSR